MANFYDAVTTVLTGDATLAAIVTGGWHDGEIKRSGSFVGSNGQLKVVGALMLSTATAELPGNTDFDIDRQWFQAWVYDEVANGYTAINTALDRVIVLLSGQRVAVDTGSVLQIDYADRGPYAYDEGLRAGMRYARFYALMKRS